MRDVTKSFLNSLLVSIQKGVIRTIEFLQAKVIPPHQRMLTEIVLVTMIRGVVK